MYLCPKRDYRMIQILSRGAYSKTLSRFAGLVFLFVSFLTGVASLIQILSRGANSKTLPAIASVVFLFVRACEQAHVATK